MIIKKYIWHVICLSLLLHTVSTVSLSYKDIPFKKSIFATGITTACIYACYTHNQSSHQNYDVKNTFRPEAEKKLRQEYAKKLIALKKEFKLSNTQWPRLLGFITAIKIFNKKRRRKNAISSLKGFHDTSLSQKIINITKKYLEKYNIDPNYISIISLPVGTNCLGKARSESIEYSYIETTKGYIRLKECNINKLPVIYLHPNLKNEPPDVQHAIIAHEVTHIVEQHGIEIALIVNALEEKGYNKNDIEQNNIFQEYIEIIEKCADLLPCTQDEKTANFMLSCLERQCHNNPNAYKKISEHPSRYSQLCALKKIINNTYI